MKSNWSDYEMFLKPVHLKGQAVTLTIVKATEEETHPQRGKTVTSPVLWFRELPFGFILSPTNRATLLALYGDRVQDCLGKPIIVKAVKEKVAGRDKEPIRIQPTRPVAPSVNTGTGEIVPAPEPAADPVPGQGAGSELESFLGTNPRQPASPAPQPEKPDDLDGHAITWQAAFESLALKPYQAKAFLNTAKGNYEQAYHLASKTTHA